MSVVYLDLIAVNVAGLEKAPAAASSLDWKATNSPDLGFVDYVDYISASKQDPAPGPGMPPFSDCHAHPGPAPNTANILLNKSLKVDLEKLPTVMTSMAGSIRCRMTLPAVSECCTCQLKGDSHDRIIV